MLDVGSMRGLITLVTLATFLGICWWAYRPGNRQRFERDALMAFDDEEVDRLASNDANLKEGREA